MDKEIAAKFNLKVNEYGLISNSYAEVAKFANFIAGKGEYDNRYVYAIHKYE